MTIEDINMIAQIANDRRFDAETRKIAKDIFDDLYALAHYAGDKK